KNTGKMAIGSARIVYIIAESGTGKTFTGDYLDVVHGFKHVDGDGPLKMCGLPKYREIGKNFWKAHSMLPHIQDQEDNDTPQNLWGPYFDECARQTLEAAKDHDRVVFTHATPRRVMQDYFVKKLVEGGAPVETISLVQLTIDPDVKYRGLYYRTGGALYGVTITEVCKAWGWEFEGEMTVEKFIDCSKKFSSYFKDSEVAFQDCTSAKKVDVSGRDITHCDNLDAALGLTRTADWSYDKICDTVKPIDEQRAKEMAGFGSLEVMGEAMEEARKEVDPNARLDEVKVETEAAKRRRSSIIQAELINGIRQLSTSSIEGVNAMKRRSTLIFKGQLDVNLEEE
ncbi:hypothetical protein ACHAWF_004814, partial [Thalassiosira exigua]